jgi:anhydro-N-acetylmuramic acid kinase
MAKAKVYRAIGLMSGTSLDGQVDVALLETDGRDYVKPLDFKPFRYEDSIREIVRPCFGKRAHDEQLERAEAAVTDVHIRAVKASGFQADIIGFHGQTITHDPANRFTWQIGDGQRLARETGMDVVCDFRSADVKAGGEGAPLLPLYHRARCASLKKPIGILNIGGVSNLTYIDDAEIIAFDCGPGNALMDDFIKSRTGKNYDDQGSMALKGEPQAKIIKEFLGHSYFSRKPPKSLDRDMWSMDAVKNLSTEDGMATLMAMTTGAIEVGFKSLPKKVRNVYICGGGRKNRFLVQILEGRLPIKFLGKVKPVEALRWNGDATEAEGFAYLAVRSLLGLPITEPSTTGAPEPMTGGVLYKAKS